MLDFESWSTLLKFAKSRASAVPSTSSWSDTSPPRKMAKKTKQTKPAVSKRSVSTTPKQANKTKPKKVVLKSAKRNSCKVAKAKATRPVVKEKKKTKKPPQKDGALTASTGDSSGGGGWRAAERKIGVCLPMVKVQGDQVVLGKDSKTKASRDAKPFTLIRYVCATDSGRGHNGTAVLVVNSRLQRLQGMGDEELFAAILSQKF